MPARLLLIEDDASIARFVEMALEDLPGVELQVVTHLAQARTALSGGGWQLVISDLMLPDGSAEALLAEGRAQGADAPPWVVFSAGLQPERLLALQALGVARTLRKPVPLAQLLSTVTELLPRRAAAAGPAPAPAPSAPATLQTHFGGDLDLFERFRTGCLARFADDIAQGDAAIAASDTEALRRVAHGLKAVLELLGHPDLSRQALALEDAATHGSALQAAGWAVLRRGLQALRQAAH
ncbi:response regulator [Roseateles sp. LKC17W]|uniref:Response regulator n=1 Tax=Pelomonas margarita TaxID=3299031 RepID=A0ABW7FL07_9BURK